MPSCGNEMAALGKRAPWRISGHPRAGETHSSICSTETDSFMFYRCRPSRDWGCPLMRVLLPTWVVKVMSKPFSSRVTWDRVSN